MSGYDQQSGVFELTATKARFWFRRRFIPVECEGLGGMDLCAALLRMHGHEVLLVTGGYLRVKATPEQVWEALSGQPSDPERAAHYYR